jgi:hypothetical protein
MRISLKFRRTIAPFRVLPFAFVATVHGIVQACVCQRMPVVCEYRRIRASPGSSGIRKKPLYMRVIGSARTRSDASRLTENHSVLGSNPGPTTREGPAERGIFV